MEWNDVQIKKFMKALADIMAVNRDYLIRLDSIVGDGDLGLTMSDGFKASSEAIADSTETDCGKLLYFAGKAMSSAVPSTMGTLMASGLMNAGKQIKGTSQMDEAAPYRILSAWLEGVQKLGKADRGEKTFVDGLAPAVDVLASNGSLDDALAAAKQGAEDTVGMLAVHGRAAIRGEESRELLDSGAVVGRLIVEALVNSVQN